MISTEIIKTQGKITDLRKKADEHFAASQYNPASSFANSNVGIGHTRWATHGPPSPINSHPHASSPANEFVVVHNGIISNYCTLKDLLVSEGYVFLSQTDTEVVPKLLDYLYRKQGGNVTMPRLAMQVMCHLEGAFALLIKSTLFPGELVACRRGSPLVFGALSTPSTLPGTSTTTQYWLASDAAALLSHTRDITVLEDEDLLHVNAAGVPVIYNAAAVVGKAGPHATAALLMDVLGKMEAGALVVRRESKVLEMEVESVMKGGYDHFMQKEIHEQPKSLTDTTRGRLLIPTPLAPAPSPLIKSAPAPGLSFVSSGSSTDSLMALDLAAASHHIIRRRNSSMTSDDSDMMSSSSTNQIIRSVSPVPPTPSSTPVAHADIVMKLDQDIIRKKTMTAAAGGRAAASDDCRKQVAAAALAQVHLGGIMDHISTIQSCRRMIFIACGTSYHACLAVRQTLEEFLGIPVALELAGDLMDREAPIFRDDCCVFVSQSGETADTLKALDYAKASGAFCVGITNTVGSAISRNTNCGIHLNAGFEIGVASTKAYTAQITALTMMAMALGADSQSKATKRDSIIRALAQLPELVSQTLQLDGAMKDLAKELKDMESLLFMGRGYNYATALEAALKVKEVALIHSEGLNAGEMKHGPLALVDENLPIIVLATQDTMHRKMESCLQQLLARNGRLVVICNEGDASMDAYAKRGCKLVRVPRTEDALQSIVNVVPIQLLSYHLTCLRGHNVDQPRNLAKSVTVTED